MKKYKAAPDLKGSHVLIYEGKIVIDEMKKIRFNVTTLWKSCGSRICEYSRCPVRVLKLTKLA
jgi:hypothetical protein